MPKSKSKTDDIALLRQDVAKLNAKVEKLQADMNKKNSKKKPAKKNGKRIAIGISAALATLVLVFGNIFFWTSRTLIDTNRYVATVGPLIKQPPIQSAIAQYTTTQVFDNFNVEGFIKSSLPPKAAFLAPELTTQVKTYTQSTIKALLNNSKVQNYWYSSLQRRHAALISFSKSYTGNGSINVSDIYSQLSKRLSGTQLSFLANKQLPAKVGSIQITTVGWLPAFHNLVNNIDLYETLAFIIFFIGSGLAIYLSPRHLRMVVKLGLVYAFFMLITLLAINIMRGVLVSDVNQTYQAAVGSAYNVVLGSLVSQTVTIMIISLVISILAWITDRFKLINKSRPYFSKAYNKINPSTSK